MSEPIVKVCVRIPASRRDELLAFASQLRADEPVRSPGWDARAITNIASEHFGGYKGLFEEHGWPERGSDMMRKVQARVKETFGSVEAFVRRFPNRREGGR